MKKIFSLLSKSHKGVSSKPCKAGLGSISLDNNYTKEYNCNNYETHNFHLCSFRGIDYLPRGCRLVANTPQNYTQQFKKLALTAILSLSLLLNFAFGAGIPVVDAAANAQISTQNAKQIAEWAKEASRWSDTISHYQKQLDAYQNELLSKTGIRDSVSFLKDTQQIYSDFAQAGQNIQSFYNDVLRDPKDFLSDKGNEIFKKYTIFDRCNFDFMTQSEKDICKINLITYAAQVETYNQASKQLDTSSQTLKKLQNRLVKTKDIKESADVGNAIQLEAAKIQMVKNQVDLANASYETQRRIKEDQAMQEYSKSFNKPRLDPTPFFKNKQ